MVGPVAVHIFDGRQQPSRPLIGKLDGTLLGFVEDQAVVVLPA